MAVTNFVLQSKKIVNFKVCKLSFTSSKKDFSSIYAEDLSDKLINWLNINN